MTSPTPRLSTFGTTPMRRRAFLGRAAGGAAMLAGLGTAGCRSAGGTGAPDRRHPWRKHGIVLASDESGWIQNFTSVAEPLGGGRWRLWTSLSGPDVAKNVGFAEGVPGGPMRRTFAVLTPGEPADAGLAIGNLPDGWRPVQSVHIGLPGGRHRLYFWAHGPKIVRYLAAESDDGRRYRVLDPHRACLYHPADRAVGGDAAREAGLARRAAQKASSPPGEPWVPAGLVSNDATNVYRLPDGTWEMYSVGLLEVAKDDPRWIAHDNCPGWVRVIDRYTSADGLVWGGRRRILVPDAEDPPDQQFYYLAVTHTPAGRIGMLGHYRCGAQTMDLEMCFSKDGVAWERPHRGAWIPRGRPGEPDSYAIYANHAAVRDGGQWHLFYMAMNEAHNHKHSHGPPTRCVMHATCPRLMLPDGTEV